MTPEIAKINHYKVKHSAFEKYYDTVRRKNKVEEKETWFTRKSNNWRKRKRIFAHQGNFVCVVYNGYCIFP